MIHNYLRRAYRAVLPALYVRRRFKLFLKAALGDIDLRVQALASVTDYFSNFVRPIPIKPPFGKSMLVVAPHQDDETIGCGGALALQLRSGNAASIVIVQDGADEHEDLGISRDALMQLRNEESRLAASVLHMEAPRFLNYSRLLESVPDVTKDLAGILMESKIDAVFTPFVLDGHDDHRTTNYILANALKQVPWNVRVLCYEVWGLTIPNVLVIIDEVMDDKLKMLRCFKFANQAIDYVHTTKGLNMYHSRLLGSGEAQYVECFFELPRLEFIDLVERVHAAEESARSKP